MKKALELAGKGKGFTSPNPCVGAVVVKDGRIIGEGYHRGPGLAHAEVEALESAKAGSTGSGIEGATLYVTLEPCNHFGKTPPCTHKIIKSKIKKVIIGCKDPNPFVSGGGIKYLRENGVEVEQSLMQQEAQDLIEDFIWYVEHNKTPFVILKSASTLDGTTGTRTGDSKWITNGDSRAFAHQLRHEVDAILIGSGTLQSDNPSLTARIENFKSKNPFRVILDTHLIISENARVLTQDSPGRTIIVTHPGSPEEKKSVLRDIGANILEVPLKNNRLDLKELMVRLGEMSVLSVMIEGGATVAGAALQAKIVNKLMLFIAPKILGGNDGKPVFNVKGPEYIKDAIEITRMKLARFGDDILVSGYLK
jgi:diaminohydroxyphosphoribosylaminopyrimidine deaminase / 5-amino-6-(5-phosphoribosylamino)uracil reductase